MSARFDVAKGDKVRVVLEGEVGGPDAAGIFVEGADGARHYVNLTRSIVESVEILEKAKPWWYPLRDGDVFDFCGARRYVIGGRVLERDGIPMSDLAYYNENVRHEVMPVLTPGRKKPNG